jgi:BASS family bile acid:Na+ symporter
MQDSLAAFVKTHAFAIEVIAIQVSIFTIVLAIGMSATWAEAVFLLRNPSLLWRSILARNILIPVAAIGMLKLFHFHPVVALTIGVLAVTPIPPIIPRSLLNAGGRSCYVLGLLVSQAAVAIVVVPLTIRAMSAIFSLDMDFSAAQVAKLIFKTILIPFVAGIALSSFFGEKVHHAGRVLATIGNILLLIAVIPLLPFAWSALAELAGEGVLAGLSALVIFGLAIGHFLGGPDEQDRTVLALATASAHPGVAIGIASANFPQQTKLVAGSVVIYMLLRAILIIPYVRWRRRPSIHGGDVHVPARA